MHLQRLTPDEAARLSGLEFVRAMIEDRVETPPIWTTFNFRVLEAEIGRVRLQGAPTPALLNFIGIIHGGWALALIDTAAGLSTRSTLPAGQLFTTVETKGNFTRPILGDSGPVVAEGRVIGQGRQIITAEVKVRDEAGRICAHGTSTLILRRQANNGD